MKNARFLAKGVNLEGRSYYTAILVLKEGLKSRSAIVKKFLDHGIQTSVYYPHPIPRLHYYASLEAYDSSRYPNAQAIADRSIAFPIGPHLSFEMIASIAKNIKEFIG